ncbi:MAG: cation diffusion facilitator family transporter [Sulfolobales archaeon]|nr:cation diffusion facilitator family transporter [Sulfolobales archaeon]MCX8186034.1 cation diffusion facilitator family transporter [Sulfolobales archaeon]MDW7969329.1 cation diffusion facilitator family transporter [Sulfolobales archaeon]
MYKNRKVAGYSEGIVSIIVNSLLFIVKYILGLMYNSIAVIADSVHTLSDAVTSLVVVFSFWVAYKPADKEHPFGHGRAEHVGSVIVGTLLCVAGYELMIASFRKFTAQESMVFNVVLVAIMMVSAIVKELLARWSLRLGSKYDSNILVSDAWHHRSDAIASVLVGLGVLVGEKFWWVDSVLGVSLSLLIIYTAVKLILTTSKEFLGYSPSPKLEDEIRKIVLTTSKEISDVHHIHIHKYGEHVEVTLHVRFPPNTPLSEAHRIATQVEKELKSRYSWEVTVHMEPEGASRSQKL